MNDKSKLINIPLNYLIVFGICFYLLLCAVHFSSGRPLWLDENSVLENIRDLTPCEIFGPLKNNQGWPRLYLFFVQKVSQVFHYNVYALRSLPFAAMIAAFFLWLRIYRKEEGVGTEYILFILAWCGSHFMTYYAAELKHYSADVLVAALFTWFILTQRKSVEYPKKYGPFLAVGYALLPFLILFSYTGYFFVLIPFYNVLMGIRQDRRNIFYAYVYTAAMLAAVVISYHFDVRYTLSDKALRTYWGDYFISVSSPGAFLSSFTEGIRNLFSRWFIETKLIRRIMTVFLPFALYAIVFGGIRRFKKDKGFIVSLETLTPVLVAGLAAAGVLKIYPFTGARVTLFIAAFIFYATIKGIELFRGRVHAVYLSLLTLYVGTLCCTSVYLFVKYLKG